jgi:hypothetical protein
MEVERTMVTTSDQAQKWGEGRDGEMLIRGTKIGIGSSGVY